jgi:RsiW-degrading membrane proteinase PrsW (M82 family)
MPDTPQTMSPRMITALIMGALLLWASYIAAGAYWYNLNPWRAVIVMACMGGFLGFWLLLLWNLKRKKRGQP